MPRKRPHERDSVRLAILRKKQLTLTMFYETEPEEKQEEKPVEEIQQNNQGTQGTHVTN